MTEFTASLRPILFGELLLDHFPDGSVVLGGAPLNVACHLRGLGIQPLLVSRIGDDEEGRLVREALQFWDLDEQGVQTDPERITGAVQVQLERGEPVFRIEPDRAYDFIEAHDVPQFPMGGAILYHGTLAVRNPVSRQALDYLIKRHRPPVFLDVNLRSPWWQAEELRTLLERANWIKLNAQELDVVADIYRLPGKLPEERAEALRALCRAEYIVVTQGESGAFAVCAAGDVARVRADASVTVVDTVGAGDAFSAALLLGLIWRWPLQDTLERARDLAGFICGVRGAVKRDFGFYRRLRESWRI
ncbi:PfkB family carbohydrate kinase [Methylocaldum sp.]|uniref:PfkB family carbohydrate kinase n=1 Tax=Methylocaldum sp. TaxID=1969727 RepID=UPI002D275363|nr:PfkB family carbohydrate kinase [Methylocaldum sp.]HYE34575.1 PfkB family carbohydrate kinase [Methylocaldum sp.]